MWKHTLVFLTLTEKLIKALSKTQPNKQKKEKGAESSWNVSSIINYSALTLFCWCFRCRVLQLKIVHPSLSPLHKGTKTEDGECHCPLLLRSCKERHILLYVVLPFETAIDAFVSFFFFFYYFWLSRCPFFLWLPLSEAWSGNAWRLPAGPFALDNLWVRKLM